MAVQLLHHQPKPACEGLQQKGRGGEDEREGRTSFRYSIAKPSKGDKESFDIDEKYW